MQALSDVSLDIPERDIFAFIGPSGCGKTTLLRSINRLNDLIRSFSLEGSIRIDGIDIYADKSARFAQDLRCEIGMVFQQPNPLPMTILNNLLLPMSERYHCGNAIMEERAIEKLKSVYLYDEVKDKLHKSALSLSGGQQQRLCIARALMLEPKIILLDEPCSALDPNATTKIEELLVALKRDYTIIIVTHNMEQARRIASNTAFFLNGKIIESGSTMDIFARPQDERTYDYVTGRR
jgi:phosphate transport system ATP-binding protein